MPNAWFRFKQFIVQQERCAMKITTDACLFGAWTAHETGVMPDVKSILDIGTGTGVLSLMIAQAVAGCNIDSIETDKDCFDQAKENISKSPWHNRITAIHGDARYFIPEHKYNVIVSNPPFYENEWQSGNEKKNIAHHSALLSLDELLKLIRTHLDSTGTFFLLLPYKRKDELGPLLQKNQLSVSKKMLVRQTTAHPYFRIMLAGQLAQPIVIEETEIAIKTNQQEYSPEFTNLLREYYLYL